MACSRSKEIRTSPAREVQQKRCYCGLPAPLKTAKTITNRGKAYYGCQNYGLRNCCTYFEWFDKTHKCTQCDEKLYILQEKLKDTEAELAESRAKEAETDLKFRDANLSLEIKEKQLLELKDELGDIELIMNRNKWTLCSKRSFAVICFIIIVIGWLVSVPDGNVDVGLSLPF